MDEHMLMLILIFVLGFLVTRMMSGGLVEGRGESDYTSTELVKRSSDCKDNMGGLYGFRKVYTDNNGTLQYGQERVYCLRNHYSYNIYGNENTSFQCKKTATGELGETQLCIPADFSLESDKR
jgi:hypothetical protein